MLKEVVDVLKLITDFGFPTIIMCLICYCLVKVISYAPTAWSNWQDKHMKIQEEQQLRNKEVMDMLVSQLKTTTIVAEQSAEVIKRNNVLLEGNQSVIREVTVALEKLTMKTDTANNKLDEVKEQAEENAEKLSKTITEVRVLAERHNR